MKIEINKADSEMCAHLRCMRVVGVPDDVEVSRSGWLINIRGTDDGDRMDDQKLVIRAVDAPRLIAALSWHLQNYVDEMDAAKEKYEADLAKGIIP